MNQYVYAGPVMCFGKCVSNNWKASTYAPSEKRARSNLTYQYKIDNNKTTWANIELPGKIITVKEESNATRL